MDFGLGVTPAFVDGTIHLGIDFREAIVKVSCTSPFC